MARVRITLVAKAVLGVPWFLATYVIRFSVNLLTLLAIVLSVGLVVDDAIVVLEAIYRHIEEGLPPLQAAYKAMEEAKITIVRPDEKNLAALREKLKPVADAKLKEIGAKGVDANAALAALQEELKKITGGK